MVYTIFISFTVKMNEPVNNLRFLKSLYWVILFPFAMRNAKKVEPSIRVVYNRFKTDNF